MTLSQFTALSTYLIQERSEATPGLWNNPLSVLSQNLDQLNSDLSLFDGSSIGTAQVAGGFSSNTLATQSGNTILLAVGSQSLVQRKSPSFTSTYNALWFGSALSSNGSRVQNAMNQAVADKVAYVVIPQALLPYSGVTYNTAVRLTREGGNPNYFDVVAYGADPLGNLDSTSAITNAIQAASVNTLAPTLQGGVVFFPAGKYIHTQTIQVPVALNQNQVILRGEGMNVTALFPSGATTSFLTAPIFPATVLFGTNVFDAAGSNNSQMQYVGMEDMRINGSLLTQGMYVGAEFAETQFCYMRNVIISNFPGSSWGLYIRGATVSGGLGASSNIGAARLNSFYNVVVANIGTGSTSTPSAVVFQNADENDFYNCNFGCAQGLTPGVNKIYTAWIQCGRNNRFFGALYTGDRSSVKSNYVAMVFGPPSNETGGPNGQVLQNQDYGCVYEGFNLGPWFRADASGNVTGNQIYGANPSIVNSYFSDENAPILNGSAVSGGAGANLFWAPNFNTMYQASRTHAAPVCVFPSGSTTPAVGGSNTWQTNNPSLTTITDFISGMDGQRMLILFKDANTVIRDVNNGGGGTIVNWGRSDLTGKTNWIVEYQLIGANWFQMTPMLTDSLQDPVRMQSSLAYLDGSSTTGAIVFQSDNSLGLYKSATSTIAVVPGGRIVVGSAAAFSATTQPEYGFGGETQLGFQRSGASTIDVRASGTILARLSASGGLGYLGVNDGSAITAGLQWINEPKLGLFRSVNSTLALSYGTFDFTQSGAAVSIATLKIKSGANNSCGTAVLGSNGSVNVANTYVAATDLIFLTDQTAGGTLGDIELGGIRAGSGFTIQSTSITDTSTVAWLIVRPT